MQDTTEKSPVFYRRKLPHWQPPGAIIFLTWRLVDSLPRVVIERLKEENEKMRKAPLDKGESEHDRAIRFSKLAFARMDEALGEQLKPGINGPRWLADPRIAVITRNSFHFLNGKKYRLHRYVIMPNHVHLLIEPLSNEEVPQAFQPVKDEKAQTGKSALREKQTGKSVVRDEQTGESVVQDGPVLLREITKSLKGYTARQANIILGRKGAFWSIESYDHWIRDDEEYGRVVNYIDYNPVKAGLCLESDPWKWSSAGEK